MKITLGLVEIKYFLYYRRAFKGGVCDLKNFVYLTQYYV